MPPKPLSAYPIAPGTPEQTQGRRADIFGSLTRNRPIEIPARVRTGHACDRCRELRAKCSGGTRCAKCTKDDATCVYSDRKRERNKKHFARSVQQIEDLQNDKKDLLVALKTLMEDPGFQSELYPEIPGLIEKMSEAAGESSKSRSNSVSQDQSQDQSKSSSRSQPAEDSSMDVDAPRTRATSSAGESLVRSDIGSPDRQRELGYAVDLNHGTGMPGYVGKMSDVAWLHRVCEYLVEVAPLSEPDLGLAELDARTSSLSYFTDDHNLLAVDEDYVDPHVLPSWQVAEVLTEAYFHSIQGAFRFVERDQFLQDLKRVYNDSTTLDWPRRRTLALANVMWAIGAKWMDLTHIDRQPVLHNGGIPLIESHLMYYARARALGLDHRMQIDHPSLDMVQGLAVLSFYLLSNGSIHRAWSLVAQTIRHATALGLHLKVLPNVLPEAEIKRRSRIWWSLFRMEVLLSEITGRPKCLSEADMTVPFKSLFSDEGEDINEVPVLIDGSTSTTRSSELWRNCLGDHSRVGEKWSGGVVPWSRLVPMGSNMSETHFAAALELSGISNRIGSTLYLGPGDLTWADVQDTVRDLEADLARWQANLQEDLKMKNIGEDDIDPRSNLDVEMTFCSVRMILYRPFMCEIHIDDESAESMKFNQLCARAGVTAAMRMTDILPDDPIAAQILQIFPWWTLLHYISQAIAIMCLELCLNVQHMQDQTREVMGALSKALNYLWVLAPESKSAYRAWGVYRPLVEKVAKRYRRNILSEMPVEATRPQKWSEDDERQVRRLVLKVSQ